MNIYQLIALIFSNFHPMPRPATIANQSTTMSVTCIIKQANANPLRHHHTTERFLHRPLSELTGQGTVPHPPALWIRASQVLTRNQPGLYLDDVDVHQHDDNQVKARQ
jgi:hypothetical protein